MPKKRNPNNWLTPIESKPFYWKIVKEFVKLFFDTSSIHGLNHISHNGRRVVERIVWIILVAAAVYGIGRFSNLTLTSHREQIPFATSVNSFLNLYWENPTVISMERDRFNWNTTFPPVTICLDTKIDMKLLDDYLKRNDSIKNKTLFKNFITSLSNASYLNLDTLVEYEGIPGEDFSRLIHQFSPKFKQALSVSSPEYEKYMKFEQTITEMGICYTFNSQLAIYNSLQYWNSDGSKLLAPKEILLINAFDGEVLVNTVNLTSGYKLYFHSPYEIVDITSKHLRFQANKYICITLSAMEIITSDRTKNLTPEQRKCRFYYESNLPHFPVYSYGFCRIECRIKLSKELCGCVPHFYKHLAAEKVCDVKGLHCLSKHREELIFMNTTCPCVASCSDTFYVITNRREFSFDAGSFLFWEIVDFPKMRLKRDIIFNLTDLFVYIGGMAGLLLGASVLSVVEIFYFFTLRLFWFVVRCREATKIQRNSRDMS